MDLSESDLKELVALAVLAARAAGDTIRGYNAQDLAVEMKLGGESLASQVVTEADRASQAAILAALRPSFARFDLGLLTEESEDDGSRFERKYFWCIDPLDGTLPFSESKSGYAVSIALVAQDGRPLIGVVYDVVEGVLYESILGHGARRNGAVWLLSEAASPVDSALTFVTDRSFLSHRNYMDTIGALEKVATGLGYSGLNVIKHGGAAMNACWVMENAPACYFKFPKEKLGGGSLWDFAATACIVAEAGGVATDWVGNPLDLNRRDSTFMNHRGILFASDERLAVCIRNRKYPI